MMMPMTSSSPVLAAAGVLLAGMTTTVATEADDTGDASTTTTNTILLRPPPLSSANVDTTGAILLLLGLMIPVPLAHAVFRRIAADTDRDVRQRPAATTTRGGTSSSPSWWEWMVWMILPKSMKKRIPFEDSPLYHMANLVVQGTKIGWIVYALEGAIVLMSEWGVLHNDVAGRLYDRSTVIQVLYTVWFATRVSKFKSYLLRRTFDRLVVDNPEVVSLISSSSSSAKKREKRWKRKVEYIDKTIDLLLFLATLLVVHDICAVQIGMILKSIFAFGGMGTIVVGLASKDAASQLFGGVALAVFDVFDDGDSVRFGDGTYGKIVDIGWFHTTLRCKDETIMSIPNSQLYSQRVSNISRVDKSMVSQTLRFSYGDAEKVPSLLLEIRKEVIKSLGGSSASGDDNDDGEGGGGTGGDGGGGGRRPTAEQQQQKQQEEDDDEKKEKTTTTTITTTAKKAEKKKRMKKKLITDGSRPCRAVLTEFRDDHVAAVVTFHFDGITPGSDEYHETRQRILEIILAVVRGRGVEFAIPTQAMIQRLVVGEGSGGGGGGGGGLLFDADDNAGGNNNAMLRHNKQESSPPLSEGKKEAAQKADKQSCKFTTMFSS